MARGMAFAGWCLAALCAIAGLLWAATPWVDFVLYRTRPPHCYEVHAALGCVIATEGGHGPRFDLRTGPHWRDSDWSWWFHFERDGINVVPLWAIMLVTGVPALLLLSAARRLRRRPGHCHGCGYDRRGLPWDAPCPECGAPQTRPAQSR
jgi:hypothetical protein